MQCATLKAETMVLSMSDAQVKNFVEALNRSLVEQVPKARLEDLRIVMKGGRIETQIKLIPIGVVTSAEDWNKISQLVERKVMGFAEIFMEATNTSKTKGKRRPPKTVDDKMRREMKEFGKALRKGQVEWIDPEDVAG